MLFKQGYYYSLAPAMNFDILTSYVSKETHFKKFYKNTISCGNA